MTPERWKEIKEILSRALELNRDQRPAYLDAACGDPTLRREVSALLVAEESVADDFLHVPDINVPDMVALPDTNEAQPHDAMIGRRLGSYQITALIGAGGMGEVYRAFRADDQYRKQVAIKLVRAGLDSRLVIGRFKNERQILASLDHPNIARLYDGGTTETGVPYFAMELIEGQNIAEYCNRLALRVKERLTLFLDVCAAVEFAHQRLIVHRDIKPANILVTAEGIPKLLDFGVAKILSPDAASGEFEPTLTLFRVLTPAYASPEQIRGEPITTASDVYSLGVVLYELLTQRNPFRSLSRTPEDISRAVCDVEPAKPSVVAQQNASYETTGKLQRKTLPEKTYKNLKGDLDDIVLMALRKDPGRRYASVEQLATDIRRHLQHLPIIARKDTLVYRTGKFVHRHTAGIAATVIVILALLAGLATTLAEKRRADRRFNDVRKLANSLVFDIHDSIKDLPGATHARQVLAEKASQYLDDLAKESSNDPSLQRELAQAYERLAKVQGKIGEANQGDTAGALQSYGKARAIESVLAARGEAQDRLRYAQNFRSIAEIQWAISDSANALKNAQQSLALSQALSAKVANNQDVLRELSADYVLAADLMTTTFSGADVPGKANELIEDYYRRALEIDEKLVSSSSDPTLRRDLAVDEFYIGRHFTDQGRSQEAVATFNKAVAIIQTTAKPDNSPKFQRDLAAIRDNMGDAFLMGGDAVQALANYQESLRLVASNAAADPADYDAHLLVGEAELHVGHAIGKTGNSNDALGHLRAGTLIFSQAATKDPLNQSVQRDLAIGNFWIARILAAGKDFAAAEYFNKATAIQKEAMRADPSDLDTQVILAGILAANGDFLKTHGRTAAAEDKYHEAVELGERLLSKAPDKAEMLYILAHAYLGLGQIQSSKAGTRSAGREEQLSGWNQAKTLFQHSAAVYRQIRYHAVVTPSGFDAINEKDIESGISRCEAALSTH